MLGIGFIDQGLQQLMILQLLTVYMHPDDSVVCQLLTTASEEEHMKLYQMNHSKEIQRLCRPIPDMILDRVATACNRPCDEFLTARIWEFWDYAYRAHGLIQECIEERSMNRAIPNKQ